MTASASFMSSTFNILFEVVICHLDWRHKCAWLHASRYKALRLQDLERKNETEYLCGVELIPSVLSISNYYRTWRFMFPSRALWLPEETSNFHSKNHRLHLRYEIIFTAWEIAGMSKKHATSIITHLLHSGTRDWFQLLQHQKCSQLSLQPGDNFFPFRWKVIGLASSWCLRRKRAWWSECGLWSAGSR